MVAGGGFPKGVNAARARWGLTFLAGVLAFGAQTSLLAPLAVGGVRPDLVLVVIAAFALHYGPVQGAIAGLAAGFFVDLYGGRLIGMGGLAKLVAGGAAGLMGVKLFRERALVPAIVVFASSCVGNLVYLALARAFGLSWPIWQGIQRVILPSAVYDAAAGLLLYPLLARLFLLCDRLDEGRTSGSIEVG